MSKRCRLVYQRVTILIVQLSLLKLNPCLILIIFEILCRFDHIIELNSKPEVSMLQTKKTLSNL